MHHTHNFDNLVVLSILISLQVVCKLPCVLSNVVALGRVKIVNHAIVEGEERSRCANFSSHVTDCGHASARKRFDTRSLVLDNSARTTLHSENTRNLEDNICERHQTHIPLLPGTHVPLGVVQPEMLPVRFTPMTLGHLSSQGIPAMTSTASAPPTPHATMPKPPALGVCESVPIMSPPGKA